MTAASTCKLVWKWVTLVLVFVDVAISWVNVYEMYMEIEEDEGLKKNKKSLHCDNPWFFWQMGIVFEGMGTLLALAEIYYIAREIQQDNRMNKETYLSAFVLVICVYLFTVYPTGVIEIFYRDRCVCTGSISLKETKKRWRKDAREFTKGLVKGVSVMFLQLFLHMSQGYALVRNTCSMFESMCQCCDVRSSQVGTTNEPSTTTRRQETCDLRLTKVGSTNEPATTRRQEPTALATTTLTVNDLSTSVFREPSASGGVRGACFAISVLMSLAYVAVFTIEILYMFCKQK